MQPEENFGVAGTINGKTYRRHRCRACKQILQNERRHRATNYINNYKKQHACQRCGYSDYRALEFHHPNPDEKDFAVSEFVTKGASLDRIKKEMEKCIILCANCHRIEHYTEVIKH